MQPTEQRPPVSRRRLGIFGVVALVGAGLIVGTGIRAREEQDTRLKEWTDDQAIPTVAVALPNAKALSPTIDLPGRLEAYSRAPIYARVSGYLKTWDADIGARVKAGQVIAEIEAPDLDQQLLQARADLPAISTPFHSPPQPSTAFDDPPSASPCGRPPSQRCTGARHR